jgi:hypothetical protein
LTLLIALGWRRAGGLATTRVVATSLMASLALLGVIGQAIGGIRHVSPVFTVQRFPEVPADVVALSRRSTLYDQRFSELAMRGDHVPTNYSACDLTAAGLAPVGLERDLAMQRYDYVLPLHVDTDYCSGFGKWEENYFWKLNQIIGTAYQPDVNVTIGGTWSRRPDPAAAEAARRMLRCFAPYRLAGTLFRIGGGGGFWCQQSPSASTIELGDIPAQEAESELLTDGEVTRISGALVARLPPGTSSIAVTAVRDGRVEKLAELTHRASKETRTLVVTIGRARSRAALAAGGTERQVEPAAVVGARLAIYASAGSQARLDLSGMTIHTKNGYVRGSVTRRGLR